MRLDSSTFCAFSVLNFDVNVERRTFSMHPRVQKGTRRTGASRKPECCFSIVFDTHCPSLSSVVDASGGCQPTPTSSPFPASVPPPPFVAFPPPSPFPHASDIKNLTNVSEYSKTQRPRRRDGLGGQGRRRDGPQADRRDQPARVGARDHPRGLLHRVSSSSRERGKEEKGEAVYLW